MAKHTFKIKDQEYKLTFNLKKVETIENVNGISLISEIVNRKGMLSIGLARSVFSLALIDAKDNSVVPQNKATELFEQYVQQDDGGVISAINEIVTRVQEDVPELFR